VAGLTHLFPEPDVLANADLAGIGVPRPRAETIRALARAVCQKQISFDRVGDARLFLDQLREIPGFSKWAAEYVAMRALGEPDAFPSEDRELDRRAEAWRPWRAYAAMYLWLRQSTV
jgi:3-methyladenine DNA glycosylase/8-oxoguanine DNA glycosylase